MAKRAEEILPTRKSLIDRLKNLEDQSGWREFFDTYWQLIYGVARKAGLTDQEAQDVVQETMAAAAKHLPTFKYDPSIGSFKAWLLNMTRWRIVDQARKRGPFAAHGGDHGQSDSTATIERMADPASQELEKLWNIEYEKSVLDAALTNVKRHLDPQKYQIFDLYVNKELSAEKVAEYFGVSVDQVYMAKHRILAAIKEEVERLKTELI